MVAEWTLAVYDSPRADADNGDGKEPAMTQASKHGRSPKMARAIARRKHKASQKRKNAAKHTARMAAR